jgi:hypothetical protein
MRIDSWKEKAKLLKTCAIYASDFASSAPLALS